LRRARYAAASLMAAKSAVMAAVNAGRANIPWRARTGLP
jgi:hypothetical protein